MNKRAVGVIFIGIAAFLYGIRYLSAAILSFKIPSSFEMLLDTEGQGPLVWSILSLIIGIIYLLYDDVKGYFVESAKTIKNHWNKIDHEIEND